MICFAVQLIQKICVCVELDWNFDLLKFLSDIALFPTCWLACSLDISSKSPSVYFQRYHLIPVIQSECRP